MKHEQGYFAAENKSYVHYENIENCITVGRSFGRSDCM